METPTQSDHAASARPDTGAVIFLKVVGDASAADGFVPLVHHHSVTLRDLAEEYNISSVLECDANGAVQPRAVAFDSPSDVLHSGRHYIARRDATAGEGMSRVTFRGKILVKEYDVDPHVTPRQSGTGSGSASVTGTPAVWRAGVVTTFCAPDQRTTTTTTTTSAVVVNVGGAGSCPETLVHPPKLAAEAVGKEDAVPGVKRGREDDEDAGPTTIGAVVPLTDRTNASARAEAVAGLVQRPSGPSASPPPRVGPLEGGCGARTDPGVPPVARPLRFLPFQADLHGTGAEVTVQLHDLAALCADVDALEAEHARRHAEAEERCAMARRVLLAATRQ